MSSYRQTLFILIILIVIILFVNEGQGAPHHDKRHTACVLKIFKALNVMCNHEGDAGNYILKKVFNFLIFNLFRCSEENSIRLLSGELLANRNVSELHPHQLRRVNSGHLKFV